jgi:hypothetical protein
VSQATLKIVSASTERIIGTLANVLVASARLPATTTPAPKNYLMEEFQQVKNVFS